MKINDIKIGLKHPPVIIAEMSGNHNNSIDTAMELVEIAAKSGAQILKLQTYTPDTMTINCSNKYFKINNKKSPWNGRNLYELYGEASTPWKWHKEIIKKANKLGLEAISTPFDSTAVDFLEELNVPAYKIASFENNDHKLIKKICSTKKPIIMSTGLLSLTNLSETYEFLKKHSKNNFALLKCTSNYPSNPSDSNILTISNMRKIFDCEIGLSDHTLGIGVPIASVALGATLIEKHFTKSRKLGGVDSAFSLEPNELKNLVNETKIAWKSLGKVEYAIQKNELPSLQFKRSIFIIKDVKKNETLSPKNIKIIRPGYGLEPKYFDLVIGRKVKRDLKKGTPLSWNILF